MTYLIMTIYSIVALAFRTPFGFIVNTAVAPIGAVFTLICIVTGSLWGKPMWGIWGLGCQTDFSSYFIYILHNYNIYQLLV